jgi:hypothetical protein
MTGLAPGITSAVQVNNSVGNTAVTLNPVVSSIDLDQKYTFTLSLAEQGSTSSSVTMELVSTTSAPDPTNYNTTPYGHYTTSTTLTGPQSPYNPTPIITSTVLESTTITSTMLNNQGSDVFQDYSLSLDTTPTGADVADAGQNLSLLIFVGGGGGTVLFTDARLTETPEPSTRAACCSWLVAVWLKSRLLTKSAAHQAALFLWPVTAQRGVAPHPRQREAKPLG